GQPHLYPARKSLGEQLGAVGAVERALLTALAMREREDRVTARVQWDAPHTGRRGPVGTLPRCERGETDDQRKNGGHDPRGRPHAPPAVNGSSAARISIARCHRSARDFASARVTTRSEEHTSELQSRVDPVCRLLI